MQTETLQDLRQTTGGRFLPIGPLPSAGATPLGRLVTQTRQVGPGDVFWSLAESGHDRAGVVQEAMRRGAAGVVVAPTDEPFGDGPDFRCRGLSRLFCQKQEQEKGDSPHLCAAPSGPFRQMGTVPFFQGPIPLGFRWVLEVEDTRRALVQWATWKRQRFTGTLVAVAGGAGRATTRRMIHAVLARRRHVAEALQSDRQPCGVLAGLAGLQPQHDCAIVELAADRPSEIAELAALCRPKVGVVLPMAEAQPGGTGSHQAAADAKAQLLAALPPDGQAVLVDDPWLCAVAAECTAAITWIGTSPGCHLRAVELRGGDRRIEFRVALGEPRPWGSAAPENVAPIRFTIPAWGRHHLAAALAAIAVGRMLGCDLDAMAAALADFQAVPERCEVLEVRGATFVLDTNAPGPAAVEAALERLSDFDSSGRRIVVCGDVAEPGPQAGARHWQTGKQVVELAGAAMLIACGRWARHVAAGARAAGMVRSRAIPCDTPQDALPFLGQAILPGDVVLVTGAGTMDMQQVAEALGQFPQRRTA